MQKLFFMFKFFVHFREKLHYTKHAAGKEAFYLPDCRQDPKGARRDPRSFVTDKIFDLLFSTVTSKVCGLGLGLTLVLCCGPLRELVLLVWSRLCLLGLYWGLETARWDMLWRDLSCIGLGHIHTGRIIYTIKACKHCLVLVTNTGCHRLWL